MWKNTMLDLPSKKIAKAKRNQQTKENKLKPLDNLNV
jgi:hypothetical protein